MWAAKTTCLRDVYICEKKSSLLKRFVNNQYNTSPMKRIMVIYMNRPQITKHQRLCKLVISPPKHTCCLLIVWIIFINVTICQFICLQEFLFGLGNLISLFTRRFHISDNGQNFYSIKPKLFKMKLA